MRHGELSTLSEQRALFLAQQHSSYDELIGRDKPISEHHLIVSTEKLSADLHLIINSEKKKKTLTDNRIHADSGALS